MIDKKELKEGVLPILSIMFELSLLYISIPALIWVGVQATADASGMGNGFSFLHISVIFNSLRVALEIMGDTQ